ncbi:SDR family NAD(P)-dependent oxidoreductase [Dictyobacter aurantiacus]|uniref:Oxidoreductase n=1 Tax=Dictyobacter aurantiacus TaxID=1936993 RepID=A0A401ZQT1_9CHLR|nr:glucose 1-dehydrogenase [Dictyobacter aurantiacus]GCE09160.1 oxidoreductase [Dictyobacter aurantiacus]
MNTFSNTPEFFSRNSLLRDKVAIITGASRGIGAAAARLFAQAGAAVVLAARTADSLNALVEEISAAGGRAVAVPTDVTNAASVEALVARTLEVYGHLDIAFNNAGVGAPNARLIDVSEEDFDRVVDGNLKSAFLCMKYEILAMLKNGQGAIVNTSSVGGLIANYNRTPYISSKHGVIGITKAAALEYAPEHIRVNAIAPGATRTEMIMRGYAGTEEGQRQLNAAIPMRRMANSEEVAEAALWLCSDAASYVTGVALPVDGGYIVP